MNVNKADPVHSSPLSPSGQSIRTEQVRLLHRNALAGITVNVVNSLIVAAVLWNHAPRPLIVSWVLAHCMVALIRMIFVRRYRRAPASDRALQRWGTLFALGAAGAGTTWGAIGFIAPFYLSLPYEVFVAFVVGGMAIGALAMSAAFMPAYVAFLLPALLPLGTGFLLQDEAMHAAMAVLTTVFIGALYLMGRNVNGSILSSIRLFLEKEKLIDKLHVEVSERQQAKQALKEARDSLEGRVEERTAELQRVNAEQARFVAILEATTDFVATVDTRGQISYLNLAGRKLLGMGPDASITDINIRDFHTEAAMEVILNEGIPTAIRDGVWSGEVALFGADGREIPVSKVIIAHKSPQGEVRCLSAIMRDITHRRQVVQDLRTAKDEAERANASKSRFLAAASHDLRQPVQSLENYLSILSQPPEQDKTLAIIHRMTHSVAAMRGLLDALLDISKLDAGRVKPQITAFPVDELLTGVQAQAIALSFEKGLDFRVVSSTCVIRSDRVLLQRIVENFVFNAIRYTESGRVLMGCRRRGGNIRIEVWDTGIGIATEALDDIFQEFTQLNNLARDRRKGLGLGLAIVQRLAALLGHRLDVRSKPGQGSMFAVEVPVGQFMERRWQIREKMVGAAAHSTGQSILLIEDDPDVLESTRLLLKSRGYKVATATTGEHALARLDRDGVKPDVILSDYRLPQGQTGVDLVHRIRTTVGQDIPAIILTGDTSTDQLSELNTDALQVLYKPIRAGRLVTLIDQLTGDNYTQNA